MLKALVLVGLLSLSLSGHAATLEERMGSELYDQAGLDQLTPAQLEVLTRWIDGRDDNDVPPTPEPVSPVQTAPATPATREAQFGQEQLKKEIEPEIPDTITSRIKGEFKGWDGRTIFRLDNGQVWQQRVGGRYRAPKRTSPDVTIERGRFGYYLKVIESGRSVGVKRIR